MLAVHWGPSEHVTPGERAALADRLLARGVQLITCERNSTPPHQTEAVLVPSRTIIDSAALDALPSLRLVVTQTSGHDHVDLEECAARNVTVARCPVARRDAVVQTSLAMALSLQHRLPKYRRDAASGDWSRAKARSRAPLLVGESTVGIVGAGVIGSRAAETWAALGARVVLTDPAVPGHSSFEEVLERSDLITLHCSLTKSSTGLIDADAVAAMRRGAILINTARGECVALDAALSGHLGGVGLDVFAAEPLPAALAADLAGRDDVVVSPHVAGVHVRLGRELVEESAAAVEAFVDERPVAHPVSSTS